MDNLNRAELSQWVKESMALLDPPANWETNRNAARVGMAAILREPREPRPVFTLPRLLWASAAAVVCIALAIAPVTRVAAQQLWQWLTVRGIEVVRVDFDSLPDEAKSLRAEAIGKPSPPQSASDVQEAAQRAGFVPRLPHARALAGAPSLSTLGPLSFGTTLRAADLELALQKGGVADQSVPKEWDGARIVVQIGTIVNAAWSQPELGLMQGLPPAISTPSGFDLGAFATAVLRAAGMKRAAAQHFGQRMSSAPALLLGIGAEDRVDIREVSLHTGPATLVQEYDDDGRAGRVSVLWSVPDRVYLLSGAVSPETAIAVANSID